ncbi:MAG: thiopurine S-methyltransferase [Gammaproteobacteria bacterium]|nr:thiopurine S-methyltransferase [Gammaproteobacteria bacterium]MDA8007636.1 thiopurine S-methyltransferase [Gammaproteobacteria bacterium]
MEHAFWRQRWAEGRLGFHQAKINSRLRKLWDALEPPRGAKVFVPLCGKSLDMLWLASRGHRVIGNELSEIACRDFFAENKLQCERSAGARFERFTGGNIEIWRGDFFDLRAEDLRDAPLCYDRAALIALPEKMRAGYAAKLAELSPPGARVLLIGMDYDPRKMKGPPFPVPEEEVNELFAEFFGVEILSRSSGPDIVGNLAARGLDTLDETVYLLRRFSRAKN